MRLNHMDWWVVFGQASVVGGELLQGWKSTAGWTLIVFGLFWLIATIETSGKNR